MPKRRDPEQRSATSVPQPGQAPAQPTGDEVFGPEASQPNEATNEGFTQKERAELEELRLAASEAYDRLSEATFEITDRLVDAYETGRAFIRDNPTSTVVGAFTVGLVLGIFSSGD